MPDLLATERLLLRRWTKADYEPFAKMNADDRVMEFLPMTLDASESDSFMGRIERHFKEHGFGLWATELQSEKKFIGFIGLSCVSFAAHFTPAVEIGWRIAAPFWNKGYATEGARKVLHFAFAVQSLQEIVSFTVPQNHPSRRVMDKLGMTHDAGDDFNHPNFPADHPLSRHVLLHRRQGRLAEQESSMNGRIHTIRTAPYGRSHGIFAVLLREFCTPAASRRRAEPLFI